MGYKTLITLNDALLVLERNAKTVLRVLDDAKRDYDALVEAQDGQTNLGWARSLFQLKDTGAVQLTVSGSEKTVECQPGHGLFAGYAPGRNVQLVNFSNADNNKTLEVTSLVSNDKLYLTDWLAPVDETAANGQVRQQATTAETDIVQDIVDAMNAMNELSLARTQDVSSADRASDLEAFVI